MYDPSLALLLASEAVNTTLKSDDYVAVNADAALRPRSRRPQPVGWR